MNGIDGEHTHCRIVYLAGLFVLPAALCSCAVGPDYQRPPVETPTTYKESGTATGEWKPAVPRDMIEKGTWWEMYDEKTLNDLQARAAKNNQNLKAAVARVDQARAVARFARAAFFPSVNLNASASRFRESFNRPIAGGVGQSNFTSSDYQITGDLGYELDIWGRVRRSVEAAKADVQATVADYETIRLTLHADVAQFYFGLRAADASLQILRDTIEVRRKALELIDIRFKGGVASDLEVAQAQTLLANAEADLADVQRQRAEFEHALAVLIGTTPESFSLPENPLSGVPPALPVGLPSELLERRPDVSEAERLMMGANARIGVAKAAFFPVIQLTGTAGFETFDIGTLFNWPSRLWSIGPSLTLPIFDGGRNSANLTRAEAAYLESVATYRNQVLNAFRDVENQLSGLHYLSSQAQALNRAVDASRRAFDLSNIRYRDGLVTYLDVVDSQRTYLDNQQAAVENLSQRYQTHVLLVKALGGGWSNRSEAGPTSLVR